MQCWHPGASFWHHFSGTDGYLVAWGQPAGLPGVQMLILGDSLMDFGDLLGGVLEYFL